ncbi:nucleoside phosphorylase [Oscillatoria sp. FACHB-1406]|uniref:nucleoside phosphorylase n=1 Tax=Oscillatoria sp. FACHB-1406 TaxID=2692846 RepID=UPI00321F7540
MKQYHIGFSREDLGDVPPRLAFLSGDRNRTRSIAESYLQGARPLAVNRGLDSYLGFLSDGSPVLCATSGMGAPSLSIVANELVQVGINQIVRIGTCGSIQPYIRTGSIVISQASLCRQGAANDIAPIEYPAAADPFLTVALVRAAESLGIDYHLGITASVDTFYEGQERSESSANPHLLRRLRGITEEYRNLRILNYEMESGTLFKMAGVYGFAAACVCAVVADRVEAETVVVEEKEKAVERAIRTAIEAVEELGIRN